jgi:hypothetical protein
MAGGRKQRAAKRLPESPKLPNIARIESGKIADIAVIGKAKRIGHRQECLCHKIAEIGQAKKKDWRSRLAIPVLHEVLRFRRNFGSSFLLLIFTSFLSV